MYLYACNIHDLETILTDIGLISGPSFILHATTKFESIYFSPSLEYPIRVVLLPDCYWHHSQLLP